MQLLFYILYLLLAVQVGYFLIFWWGFRKKQRAWDVLIQQEEGVSVIVAARNERQNLQRLLPVLLNQQYPVFEIVVVDDRSEDGTEDFVRREFPDSRLRVLRIEDCPEDWNPKKHALNTGIAAARYGHLLFTDADCVPTSARWLRLMTAPLRAGKQVVLGYSPYVRGNGWLNRFIRFETLFTAMQYLGLAGAGRPYMGVGRNIAYQKVLYEQHGGFDAIRNITGGDDDLFINRVATKTNTAVQFDPDTFVSSLPETAFGEWVRQKKRHLSVGSYYSWKSRLLLGGFYASLVGFYLLLLLLLLFCGYYKALLVIYLGRWLLVSTIFALISAKLNDHFNNFLYSLLEILYIMYLTWGGAWMNISMKKRITWK